MNTYILIEGGGKSFQTFLKENYAITLDSWLFTKNMELTMILIVFMENLQISKIYRRFDEFLAILADDEFYTHLVRNRS